jgi:hypothetical protein
VLKGIPLKERRSISGADSSGDQSKVLGTEEIILWDMMLAGRRQKDDFSGGDQSEEINLVEYGGFGRAKTKR